MNELLALMLRDEMLCGSHLVKVVHLCNSACGPYRDKRIRLRATGGE